MRSTVFFPTTAALLAASPAPRTRTSLTRPPPARACWSLPPYGKATGEKCPAETHRRARRDLRVRWPASPSHRSFRIHPTNKIEAVYIFPLPQMGAVDDMTIETNGRKIRALIKPRDEARRVYEGRP